MTSNEQEDSSPLTIAQDSSKTLRDWTLHHHRLFGRNKPCLLINNTSGSISENNSCFQECFWSILLSKSVDICQSHVHEPITLDPRLLFGSKCSLSILENISLDHFWHNIFRKMSQGISEWRTFRRISQRISEWKISVKLYKDFTRNRRMEDS